MGSVRGGSIRDIARAGKLSNLVSSPKMVILPFPSPSFRFPPTPGWFHPPFYHECCTRNLGTWPRARQRVASFVLKGALPLSKGAISPLTSNHPVRIRSTPTFDTQQIDKKEITYRRYTTSILRTHETHSRLFHFLNSTRRVDVVTSPSDSHPFPVTSTLLALILFCTSMTANPDENVGVVYT